MPRLLSVLATLAAPSLAFADIAGLYSFTVVPTQSGLTATVQTGVETFGTLIGNYDEVNNPTGTRTKPGFFGSFGPTENLPVDVALGAGLNGTLNTDTTGAFDLDINTAAGTVLLSNYAANFLGNGPASLPITVSLTPETFRTRNPTFLYPGVPLTVPIGNATLTSFAAAQAGPSAGTITQTGPNTYNFSVGTLVNLSLAFDVLGNTVELPGGAPIPFVLTGSLTLNGSQATITSVTPLLFDQSQQPNQTLPQFPLALPTLDPNAPANVLFDLSLSEIAAQIDGQFQTTAAGVLIPAPAGVLLALGGGMVALRRRR